MQSGLIRSAADPGLVRILVIVGIILKRNHLRTLDSDRNHNTDWDLSLQGRVLNFAGLRGPCWVGPWGFHSAVPTADLPLRFGCSRASRRWQLCFHGSKGLTWCAVGHEGKTSMCPPIVDFCSERISWFDRSHEVASLLGQATDWPGFKQALRNEWAFRRLWVSLVVSVFIEGSVCTQC